MGKNKIALIGAIYYRDFMGDHESKFCAYAVPPVHEHPHESKPAQLSYYFGGPEAYNRYT